MKEHDVMHHKKYWDMMEKVQRTVILGVASVYHIVSYVRLRNEVYNTRLERGPWSSGKKTGRQIMGKLLRCRESFQTYTHGSTVNSEW